MKETVEKYLDYVVESISKGKDFLKEELPPVVDEILKYELPFRYSCHIL